MLRDECACPVDDVARRRIDRSYHLLDFFTRPHFKPVILDPTTGAVVSG